jgi:hypothetical protein
MNDTAQGQNQNNAQPEYLNRWEARHLRREERLAARGYRSGSAWIFGGILVIVGIALLLQNLGTQVLGNWRALFILLPAMGAFSTAWKAYQTAGGRLCAASRGSLITGLIFTTISVMFLLSLDWTLLGPALTILAGIALLINAILPD